MPVVLITGCSSGFGKLTTIHFALHGYDVYATVRSASAETELREAAGKSDATLNILQLDITDEKAINNTVNLILQQTNQIDVLINNAGISIPGVMEDMPSEDISRCMLTNYFGPIWLTRAVLPAMRANKHGHIIMVSSLSALVGLPTGTAYGASKAALETAAEGLRYEVDRFGIKVSVIEPGLFNTAMPEKAANSFNYADDSAYGDLMAYIQERVNSRLGAGDDPQVVAELILKIAETDEPAFRYPAGEQAQKVTNAIQQCHQDSRGELIRQAQGTEWWSKGDKK